MSRTAQNMKRLIEKKYYPDPSTTAEKLDLLMLTGRISEAEYTELIALTEGKLSVASTEPIRRRWFGSKANS